MSGPVYSFVRLFLATLYPAYYSFKAVKNKNVKEWVFWELLIIELSIIRQLQVCQVDDVLDHLRILYCIWISHGSIPYFLVRKNKGTMKEEKEVNVFFQASFLQRGQDGLAALLGGTGYKRVRSYIQKVTILLLIIRMWWLICNMCSTSDADYSDYSDDNRWLHPFLCDKEEEIDAVLQRVKEQVDI